MEQYLTIDSGAYEEMIRAIACRPPESGGILGGTCRTISRFHFDEFAYTDSNSYVPDIETLNPVIQSWQNVGLRFMGIVHSHDQHPLLLSTDDIAFAHSILRVNESILSRVYFILIICPFISFYESLFSFVITPKKCCSITLVIQ